jgi:hypothetical protein
MKMRLELRCNEQAVALLCEIRAVGLQQPHPLSQEAVLKSRNCRASSLVEPHFDSA